MCREARFPCSVVVLLVLAIAAFAAAPAAAQSTTGTILGHVTDAEGLALPGATVTATNTETGATRTVVTGGDGGYLIPALQVGRYRVNITMSGFRPFRQEEFSLSSAQNARVDARLAVGGVTEQIDVVATAVRVDTRSSAVVTNIDRQRMEELPMLNRSVLSLAVLAPGITDVTVPDAVIEQRSGPQITAAATGARMNQNDVQLDGATLLTSLYNRPSNLPSPDSIQEFQVLTNSYSAEFGRGGGTSMLAITKSGGNSFRGGAWEYHRNDALNGMDYFATQKPFMDRHQFGANLGGPIKSDQTFFFVNFERLRLDQDQILTFNPPIAAMRAGDFSVDRFGDPQTTIIYDPVTQEPFPGNRIPANRFDPQALRLLEFVPLPNQPNGEYIENTARNTQGDQITIKVDHKLTSANTFTVRYYRDVTSGVRAAGNLQQFWTRMGNTMDTWTITNTHLFGNNMVGEGRLSLTMIDTNAPPSPAASQSPRDLGFLFDQGDPIETPRIPRVFVSGAGGAFDMSSQGVPWVEESPLRGGNYGLSWLTGRHNLKFGFEYLYRHRVRYAQNNSSGTLGHDGASTRRQSDGDGGLGMADFLLGRPTTYTQGTPFNGVQRVRTYHLFAQDDVRLNRLTLNLGVRLDVERPWREDGERAATYVRGQQSTRYPGAPVGLVFPGDEGIPPGFVPTTFRLAPRTGFALDLRGDGRTALRGGYGLFNAMTEAVGVVQANEVPPYFPSVNFSDPFSLADPWGPNRTSIFPYIRNDSGEGIFPALPVGFETVGLEWRPGHMHQFNLMFQQQLGNEIVVSAGYVGSRGRKLTQFYNANLAEFIPGASTPQNVQARRPDQNFSNVVVMRRGSWSDYDSLQVTAMKQYANNYTLQLNYTLGRTYDDGNVAEHATTVQDPNNPLADHALASNDRTHVLRLNGLYELPRLLDKPAVVRLVVGGWRLAGIASYLSGTMVNVTSGVDRTLIGCGGCAPQRPNLNGDPKLPSNRSRDERIAQWFNTDTTTLWTLPDLGQFGNAPRNPLRGPSRFNTDMSLTKIFRLSSVSNRRVEIRIEAFNVFDTVNLNNPNGNRNTANFGRITSAQAPRVMQLALRFDF